MTNVSFEFFYKIFTEDASLPLLYHGAKKSKMTKNSNQGGGGSCLKFSLPNIWLSMSFLCFCVVCAQVKAMVCTTLTVAGVSTTGHALSRANVKGRYIETIDVRDFSFLPKFHSSCAFSPFFPNLSDLSQRRLQFYKLVVYLNFWDFVLPALFAEINDTQTRKLIWKA